MTSKKPFLLVIILLTFAAVTKIPEGDVVGFRYYDSYPEKNLGTPPTPRTMLYLGTEGGHLKSCPLLYLGGQRGVFSKVVLGFCRHVCRWESSLLGLRMLDPLLSPPSNITALFQFRAVILKLKLSLK